jgi:hypothetical protein
MYKGRIRLGDFYQSATSAGVLDFQVDLDQLIAIATDVMAMRDGFELTSAVVNDYILTHNAFRDKFTSSQTGLSGFSLGSEIIEYVVLQTPGKNITNGDSMPFTMIAEVFSNVVVFPSVNNVLLYKTFQPIWMGKEDKQFEGVEYHGSIHGVLPPRSKAEISKFIKELPAQSLMTESAGSTVSPVLLNLSPPTLEILYGNALAKMQKSRLYDMIEEIEDSKECEVLGNPALLASSIASGLKILYDNRGVIKDVGKTVIKAAKSKTAKKIANKILKTKVGGKVEKIAKKVAGAIKVGLHTKKELQKLLSSTRKGSPEHDKFLEEWRLLEEADYQNSL